MISQMANKELQSFELDFEELDVGDDEWPATVLLPKNSQCHLCCCGQLF